LAASKRALVYDLFDLFHFRLCSQESFHKDVDPDICVCKVCNAHMDHFHRFDCPSFSSLSSCQTMKKVSELSSS
jgi:hypothetical protein